LTFFLLIAPLARAGEVGVNPAYNGERTFIAPLPVVSEDLRSVPLNVFYSPRLRELNDINTLGFWITFWSRLL
jgi:hypothetical protein